MDSVQRMPLHKNPDYQKSGPKSYARAIEKYKRSLDIEQPRQIGASEGRFRTLTKTLLKSFKKQAQQGTVPAQDMQHDAEYLCAVAIGTPAQTLNLDFDTGSSDLWCWSTKMPKSTVRKYANTHGIYDPSKSSTFKDIRGASWQIQYGDQSSASGTVGTDTISLGGVVIQNQAIEMASKLSAQFEEGAGDGLLGLAWPSINTVKPHPVATPVQNMIEQTSLATSAQLFTAYLGSYKDAGEADKGESFYTFGVIDTDVLKAHNTTEDQIYYAKIDNSKGFWEFDSTSAHVNGQVVELPLNNTAIADTGTTLALVSDQLCRAVYNNVPGATFDSQQQGWLFPSTLTAEQLPVVEVDVGGKLFTIQKEDLSFADGGNGMVYGGIQSRGDMPLDILGDTFLKGIYAIFDQGAKRFGAVPRVEKEQNLAVPSSNEM